MFLQAFVSHSVQNRRHDYTVTAHPCYGAVLLEYYYHSIDPHRHRVDKYYLNTGNYLLSSHINISSKHNATTMT